jgi:four helix bundle protein
MILGGRLDLGGDRHDVHTSKFWVLRSCSSSVRGSAFGVRCSVFVYANSALSPMPDALQIVKRLGENAQICSAIKGGILCAHPWGMGVQRFTDLRAWQVCRAYKLAVYRLCSQGTLATDVRLRKQLEDAVAGPPGHVAEGFGRFSPPDFARFLVMARASLMESQNHLSDAVDKGHINEEIHAAHNRLAENALEEVTGLMEYLQSPEALRNARRARERRIASRAERRTPNLESATQTANPELRSPNPEPRTEPEHEPRTENRRSVNETPTGSPPVSLQDVPAHQSGRRSP